VLAGVAERSSGQSESVILLCFEQCPGQSQVVSIGWLVGISHAMADPVLWRVVSLRSVWRIVTKRRLDWQRLRGGG